MSSELTFFIALATFLGGALVGLAALRKSGSEASKASADATAVLVGASADVVKQLREQLEGLADRVDEEQRSREQCDIRIAHLEKTVNTWEVWADRVLSLLDRSLAMLNAEQSAKLEEDVNKVKRTRPMRARVEKADDR